VTVRYRNLPGNGVSKMLDQFDNASRTYSRCCIEAVWLV
jgi:hypothetical protein